MPAIDLNADLGEGDELSEGEQVVLDVVTSTSVSCGVHAGSPAAIEATVAAAAARHVVIGAHPSYPDRAGAGRRDMQIDPVALAESLVAQVAVVARLAEAAGSPLRFVKPHGALYNRLTKDAGLGAVVVDALRTAGDYMLLLQAGAASLAVAERAGVRCATEGFADRAYLPDGRLVARAEPGAVLEDEEAVVAQALSIALDRRVRAVDGSWVHITATSLCLHGDTPGAATLARGVRGALEDAGVMVAPFAR
ncbi:MAG TPA: 5-oxoprolinase subunit PxpA [Acidimicrobiales bacterium]|nr:5-oxoprolinase subunit PxpA [Acidimicrobiales bacterium]